MEVARPATDSARKVIWAGGGTPKLAWETVIGGFQDDGTPSKLHVITDATTGKELYRYEGIETGVGNTRYSGQVSLTSTKSGSSYTLTDAARRPQDVQPQPRHLRHRHPVLAEQHTWGDGTNSPPPPQQRTPPTAPRRPGDFYKDTFRAQRHQERRCRRLLPRPLRQRLRQRLLGRQLLLHDLRRRHRGQRPADLAGHRRPRDEPRPHPSNTAGLELQRRVRRSQRGDLPTSSAPAWSSTPTTRPTPVTTSSARRSTSTAPAPCCATWTSPARTAKSADSWSSSLGNLDVHYSSGPANHMFYLVSEGSGTKTINGVTYNSPDLRRRRRHRHRP